MKRLFYAALILFCNTINLYGQMEFFITKNFFKVDIIADWNLEMLNALVENKDIETAMALYKRSWFFAYNEDFDKAIIDMQKVVKQRPDALMPHFDLGRLYLVAADYRQALSAFEDLIELDPKLFDAFLYAGIAAVGFGEVDKAIQFFEKANSITANNDLTHLFLAHCYLLKAQRNNSIFSILEKDIAFYSTYGALWNLNINSEYIAKAEEHFLLAMENLQHQDVNYAKTITYIATISLGAIHCYKNNTEKALKYLDITETILGENLFLYYFKALAYLQKLDHVNFDKYGNFVISELEKLYKACKYQLENIQKIDPTVINTYADAFFAYQTSIFYIGQAILNTYYGKNAESLSDINHAIDLTQGKLFECYALRCIIYSSLYYSDKKKNAKYLDLAGKDQSVYCENLRKYKEI